MTLPRITIRRAHLNDLDALTALSMRSKQSNGYDDAFMQACRDELAVTQDSLRGGEYWVAEGDAICGLACIACDPLGNTAEITAFFIEPDRKRQGIGTLLWRKLLERAADLSIRTLRLDADPAAVPFYTSLGFRVVGEAPSGSIAGRTLPHMTLTLEGTGTHAQGTLPG